MCPVDSHWTFPISFSKHASIFKSPAALHQATSVLEADGAATRTNERFENMVVRSVVLIGQHNATSDFSHMC